MPNVNRWKIVKMKASIIHRLIGRLIDLERSLMKTEANPQKSVIGPKLQQSTRLPEPLIIPKSLFYFLYKAGHNIPFQYIRFYLQPAIR